jgi:hypothetical protein
VSFYRTALLACAGVLSIAAGQAAAATYVVTGVGSGSANGTAFSNKSFTFTLTGTPTSSTSVDPLTSAMVAIAGVGTFTFHIDTRLRESGSTIYFSKGSGGADLFSVFFTSPINLTTNNAGAQSLFASTTNAFTNIAVNNNGTLTFGSIDQVSFSASQAAPVPEPAAWLMLVGGFGAMGAALRRRPARVTVRYA